MRIGIDAHILGKNAGGVERYVQELSNRIPPIMPEHEFIFFVNRVYWERLKNKRSAYKNCEFVVLPVSDPLLQRSVVLPFFARKKKIDLLHTQRILPFFISCRCVVSIHDILPVTNPDNHPGIRNAIIRALTPWSAKKALKILTVSDTVKNEIANHLNISKSKIFTIYNGIDHNPSDVDLSTETLEYEKCITSPYIFYSGAIEPRKNLLLVIKAFQKVRQKIITPFQLILSGMVRDTNYKALLSDYIYKHKLNGTVVFTDYVSETTLDRLHKNASLFIAPSLGEGFDLPPLEAMRRGTAVICSDIDVHREILKDAALFFHENSSLELACAILRLLNNPDEKQKMINKGLQIANKFKWEHTACQTATLYKEIGQIIQ